MTDNQRTYATSITNTSHGWNCCDIDVIQCKPMTAKEIKNYMNEINHHKTIPLDSCLYSVNVDFQDLFQRKIFITTENQYKSATKKSVGGLYISVQLKNCKKCDATNCFSNLEDGKCRDDFVRKIIGEKLLKDKYENQK